MLELILALLLALPFILTFLLPAIFELVKPQDSGPKLISDITSPRRVLHKKLEDIEPYIPDLATENCDVLFGIEALPNIEALC